MEMYILKVTCDLGFDFLTGLRSGHLLLSIKSRCRCFGKETIDWTEVPEDLIAHGIQVSSACFTDPRFVRACVYVREKEIVCVCLCVLFIFVLASFCLERQWVVRP